MYKTRTFLHIEIATLFFSTSFRRMERESRNDSSIPRTLSRNWDESFRGLLVHSDERLIEREERSRSLCKRVYTRAPHTPRRSEVVTTIRITVFRMLCCDFKCDEAYVCCLVYASLLYTRMRVQKFVHTDKHRTESNADEEEERGKRRNRETEGTPRARKERGLG